MKIILQLRADLKKSARLFFVQNERHTQCVAPPRRLYSINSTIKKLNNIQRRYRNRPRPRRRTEPTLQMLPTAREPIAYPLTRRPAAKRQIARREEAARARRVDARRAPNSDRRARRRARRGVISLSRGAAERDRHFVR